MKDLKKFINNSKLQYFDEFKLTFNKPFADRANYGRYLKFIHSGDLNTWHLNYGQIDVQHSNGLVFRCLVYSFKWLDHFCLPSCFNHALLFPRIEEAIQLISNHTNVIVLFQFYTSTLNGLADLFEDEIIPTPIPMKVRFAKACFYLQNTQKILWILVRFLDC